MDFSGIIAKCFQAQVPDSILTDAEAVRRHRLIIAFAKLGIWVGLAYTLFYFFSGFRYGALIVGSTVFWMGLTWPLLAFKCSHQAVGNYLACLMMGALITVAPAQGGIHSPAIPWLAVPPLVSLLISGRKSAICWCFLAVTSAVIFTALERRGVRFTASYPSNTQTWQLLSGYGGLIFFSFAIAYLIEQTRERSFRELQTAAAQLAAANKQLENLNRDRSEFLRMIAHDLNNPLSVILGQAFLLQDGLASSPEHLKHSSVGIISAVKRIQNNISEMVDLNTIEQSLTQLEWEPVDLTQLCQTTARNFRWESIRKQIQIIVEIVPAPVIVTGETQTLQRLIENLLSNALKYSPPQKRIWFRLRIEMGKAVIEVEDEGPGIPEAERSRLFQKFSRLSTRPTGGESSHGLGLFIVRRFVEAQNGTVNYVSAKSGGACFVVRLPLEQDGENRKKQAAKCG